MPIPRTLVMAFFLACYVSFALIAIVGHYSVQDYCLLSISHGVFMWSMVPVLLKRFMPPPRRNRLIGLASKFCYAGLLVLILEIVSHLTKWGTRTTPPFTESSVFMSMAWLLLSQGKEPAHGEEIRSRDEAVGEISLGDHPRVVLVGCVLATFYFELALLLSVVGRPQDMWMGCFLLIGLHVAFALMGLLMMYEEQVRAADQLSIELLMAACCGASCWAVVWNDNCVPVACAFPSSVKLCAIVAAWEGPKRPQESPADVESPEPCRPSKCGMA